MLCSAPHFLFVAAIVDVNYNKRKCNNVFYMYISVLSYSMVMKVRDSYGYCNG